MEKFLSKTVSSFYLADASSAWTGDHAGVFLLLRDASLVESVEVREIEVQANGFRLDRELSELELAEMSKVKERLNFLHDDVRVWFTLSSS